jgi:hypothetical protein
MSKGFLSKSSLLRKKEFTYNLKGQNPKHTRRGFSGFCLNKKGPATLRKPPFIITSLTVKR